MKKELLEDLERLMSFVPKVYPNGLGYRRGWVNEANEMRNAIAKGTEISEEWCLRDLTVHLDKPHGEIGSLGWNAFGFDAVKFFDGSYNFRAIAQNLVHIHSFDNPSEEMLQYRDNIFNNVLK